MIVVLPARAPGGGIEPPLTDSKSAVLPLDDPGMGVVPRGLLAFWPLSSPGCAPRMPRQTPRSALSGPSTVCRAPTLFQTVSGRMRREHRQTQLKGVNIENEWLTASEAAREARVSRATLYRYWPIGVGPRYSQLSTRRLVRRAWLTDWLLAQEADRWGSRSTSALRNPVEVSQGRPSETRIRHSIQKRHSNICHTQCPTATLANSDPDFVIDSIKRLH